MAEVLVSWIIIGITSYTIGFEICLLLSRMMTGAGEDISLGVSHPHVFRCLMGLCAINVYAEVFSLFTGIGMWADYILMLICLLIVFFDRSRLGQAMDIQDGISKHPVKTVVSLCLILLMSYGTSRGYMHFDTNLYHAQAIHWIEDYGVVPGLVNIQSRFGYNSAEFALNALFGFKWYLGRSLHTSAGFFALLSAFVAMDTVGAFVKGKDGRYTVSPRISDYVRIGLIFYLGLIYNEMISPASDYYAQLMLFDIVILWLDTYDIRPHRVYGILSILIVYAVTIKLSLAPLVLFALIPGIYWIKNKDHKNIIVCLLSGLIIAVPYFVRGYIISGWILYPSTLIGIGSPDWRLPKGMAQYDAREIGMWGRGITRAEAWDSVTAFNWIPGYIGGLSPMEKLWIALSLVSVVIVLVMCIKEAIRSIKTASVPSGAGNEPLSDDILPVAGILCVGMLTWFVSAPLVRYGYAYIIIVPLMTLGRLSEYIDRVISGKNKSDLHNTGAGDGNDNKRSLITPAIFIGLTAAIAILKARGIIVDITRTIGEKEYYVNQQDYIDADAYTYIVDGITVYVAEDSGQIGYYKLPSTVEERHDFALRGDDISDGFYHIN